MGNRFGRVFERFAMAVLVAGIGYASSASAALKVQGRKGVRGIKLGVVGALMIMMTAPAQAAPWTFTATGTIDSGFDNSGVWGSDGGWGNMNLNGRTFTQSITLDPTQFQYNDSVSDPGWNYSWGPAAATETLTIDGVSKTYTIDLSQSWGNANAQTYDRQPGGWEGAYAQLYLGGLTTEGVNLELAGNYIFSNVNAFNLGLPSETRSYNSQPGDHMGSQFDAHDNYNFNINHTYFFTSNVSSMEISSNAVAAVPEPETYAMMLAGLGLLGFMASRRKQKAA